MDLIIYIIPACCSDLYKSAYIHIFTQGIKIVDDYEFMIIKNYKRTSNEVHSILPWDYASNIDEVAFPIYRV